MLESQEKSEKPKKNFITTQNFFQIWQNSKSIKEVCEVTHLKPQSVYQRANKLRKELEESVDAQNAGVVLKKLPMGNAKRGTIADLIKFAQEKKLIN
jgi:hypothetical protein